MHNIMSTTGVRGVQATMLSLTSPQKNAFKRPEQNVRIFFLPIFIACLERTSTMYSGNRKLLNLSEPIKQADFITFFLGSQCSFKSVLNLSANQYFLDQLALNYSISERIKVCSRLEKEEIGIYLGDCQKVREILNM
jgi:hypothetical protein